MPVISYKYAPATNSQIINSRNTHPRARLLGVQNMFTSGVKYVRAPRDKVKGAFLALARLV